MSQPSPPVDPGAGVPRRRHSYGSQKASDMVRSMLVVAAVVLGVFFVTLNPQGQWHREVDITGVVQQAQAAGLLTGSPPLPARWQASNARFGPDAVEGVPTAHLGYLDPDGSYGGISTAVGATPAWVQGVAGIQALPAGTRELEGVTWQVWTNQKTAGTTLVWTTGTGTAVDQITTVTSRGNDAALRSLVRAAIAVNPVAGG